MVKEHGTREQEGGGRGKNQISLSLRLPWLAVVNQLKPIVLCFPFNNLHHSQR